MDSLSVQLYAFVITLLAGASFGLLFDLYRLLRGWLRPGTIATVSMDLFFWVVATPVLAVYILMANWGELRLYVLIGVLLGLAFYYLIFSRLVISLLTGICTIIARITSWIIQIGYMIIMWPVRIIQDISLRMPINRLKQGGLLNGKTKLRWQSPLVAIFKRR